MNIIQISSVDIIRGWQGHKDEQRWFSALQVEFRGYLIEMDNLEALYKDLGSIKDNLNID